MQIWVLQNEETGTLRGKFHDGQCPGVSKGETEGAKYIRMEIEDLPDSQGACFYCFEGRGATAVEVRSGYTPRSKGPAGSEKSTEKGIAVGHAVGLRFASGEVKTFTLVHGDKGSPSDGLIASESAMGKALLGKEVGEVIAVKAGSLEIVSADAQQK